MTFGRLLAVVLLGGVLVGGLWWIVARLVERQESPDEAKAFWRALHRERLREGTGSTASADWRVSPHRGKA